MATSIKLLAAFAAGSVFATGTLASSLVEDILPEHVPTLVGGAVGAIPDYLGSDDYFVGIAPIVRYQLPDSRRYIQVFTNELNINLLDSASWAAGPVANLNLGRTDVKDKVVKHMEEVDPRVEYGAFVRYQSVDASNPRNRWNLSLTGMTRDASYRLRATAQIFRQVSPTIDMNLGVGAWYGDKDANNSAVGINAGNRGTSGLPDFVADAGINQYFVNLGGVMYLNREWALVGGLKYAHVPAGGDKPGSSPMIEDRGDNDMWVGGVGVIYMMW